MTDPAAEVEAWVREVVVGLGLCPFAAAPMGSGGVRFLTSGADGDAEVLAELFVLMQEMHAEPSPSTMLLVIPGVGWDAFLDLVGMAEGLIEVEGYEGVFQLASFHPDYVFADVDADDPANHTNRTPHPAIQILRVDEVGRAVDTFGDTDAIFERNVKLMRDRAK